MNTELVECFFFEHCVENPTGSAVGGTKTTGPTSWLWSVTVLLLLAAAFGVRSFLHHLLLC